jgi:glutamyl-tRNA synthetase
MEDIREAAVKYALFNAIQYGGKANPGSVMGRIFAEFSEAKTNAKEVQRVITSVVLEINTWSPEKQKVEVAKYPEIIVTKKIEDRKTMPPLKNVHMWPMVKTRFAPNPDGPLHLGSAEPIIFCDEYAKMYKGHFILRFEDTSADVKPPIPQMYEWIPKDLEWLGVKVDEIYIQSDRLKSYYDIAEQVLKKGAAYVCVCNSDDYKTLYMTKQPCPCRELPPEEHLKRWKRMLDGEYKRGQAVVRVKTDITHPNPAIRDWPALRIASRSHPRVGRKYRVWPLYNFSCAIDDHLMEVSHVIRGKEHETNGIRQKWLYDHMGWHYPEIINIGRLGIEAGILSKSKIRAGVESGAFNGWDDPRLGTLRALRRRGLQPETIREIMVQVGPKPINGTLSWGNIAAANRKVIEPRANRYFFVNDKIPLKVKGITEEHVAKLHLHPDHPERGDREYSIKPAKQIVFLMPRKDIEASEGKVIRLMGLMNVKVTKLTKTSASAEYHSRDHQKARDHSAPFIHWLTEENSMPVKVIMPDASINEGIAERKCEVLKIDDMIQFERFGFVRVDQVEPWVFYYSHD